MKQYMNLKMVQNEEKRILKELIRFLEENDIQYFIWAGSFLGAVRHNGFIPWDDDIDIAISRIEYEKLISILKKNNKISKDIEAIGFEIGKSDFPFIKIINKTIELEGTQCDKNLWIDVFPLDGMPRKSKIFCFKVKILKTCFFFKRSIVRNINIDTDNFIKNQLKKMGKFLVKPFDYNKLIKKYINLCSKYNVKDCKFVANNVWGIGEKEKFPKELLLETAKYKFEDLEVIGIKNYDKWLNIRYGDYMQLPPEEERVTHEFEAWRVEKNDKEIKE